MCLCADKGVFKRMPWVFCWEIASAWLPGRPAGLAMTEEIESTTYGHSFRVIARSSGAKARWGDEAISQEYTQLKRTSPIQENYDAKCWLFANDCIFSYRTVMIYPVAHE